MFDSDTGGDSVMKEGDGGISWECQDNSRSSNSSLGSAGQEELNVESASEHSNKQTH